MAEVVVREEVPYGVSIQNLTPIPLCRCHGYGRLSGTGEPREPDYPVRHLLTPTRYGRGETSSLFHTDGGAYILYRSQ